MRLLELFPNDGKQTLYVCRHLKNTDEFIKWIKSQGFKSYLPADQYHVTIAYSKEPVDINDVEPLENTLRVKGTKRKIEKLGSAIVLSFDSDELYERWSEFVNDIECSWDFPSYKQHITITYEGDNVNPKDFEPYEGELIFGPEEFSEISSDFKNKFKEIKLKESLNKIYKLS